MRIVANMEPDFNLMATFLGNSYTGGRASLFCSSVSKADGSQRHKVNQMEADGKQEVLLQGTPGRSEHKWHSFPIFRAVVGVSILQLPANSNIFQMSSSRYHI